MEKMAQLINFTQGNIGLAREKALGKVYVGALSADNCHIRCSN